MKKTKILCSLLAIFTLMSFNRHKSHEKLQLKTGTYGVCTCGNSTESSVKLILNKDFTFHYTDNSYPGKKTDVKGNWVLNDNTVTLKDYTSDLSIHNKWTIDRNEKCLKSRKGLNFTRLCNVEACE
jgi:hypothetical protein